MFTFPTGLFVPSQAGDPFWASVVFLQNFQGANGSKPTTDQSQYAHPLAWGTGASILTAQSPFVGGSSLYCTSTDFVQIPNHTSLNLAGSDWTIEYWVFNPVGSTATNNITKRLSGSPTSSYQCYSQFGTKKLSLYQGTEYASSFVIPDTQWVFAAFSYLSGSLRIYANGVSALGPTPISITEVNTPLVIGGILGYSSFPVFLGPVRITKGIARYTANFTPPTAPFPTGP